MGNSYIVLEEIEMLRQAGDTGMIEFILPDILDPALFEIRFTVCRKCGTIVFEKEPSSWTKTGQNIKAPLTIADTTGKPGRHRWELELRSPTETITAAKGDFIILSEYIKQ
jgi:hypothetical protein